MLKRILSVILLAGGVASAQTNFFWTNAVTSVWNSSGNWTNETGSGGPAAGGSNDYIIVFQRVLRNSSLLI
jgi:hypothetical protein